MTRAAGRPLALVNPDAGAGLSEEEVQDRLPDADVRACPRAELTEAVEAAVRESAPYVAVAGGDGTVRAVAALLVGTDTALLAIPGGTLNHFARAMGVSDLDAAAAAARAGTEQMVDVGDVNGHIFLNTACIGAYPRMVARREHHEARLPRWLAQPLATLQEIRHGRPIHVEIDRRQVRVWLVFVGNGRYGGELGELGIRESVSANELDVRVVTARGRWPRTRLVLALFAGRLSRSAVVESSTCRELTVDLAGRGAHSVGVALDGDVEVLDAPLHFRSRARALRVRYNQPS